MPLRGTRAIGARTGARRREGAHEGGSAPPLPSHCPAPLRRPDAKELPVSLAEAKSKGVLVIAYGAFVIFLLVKGVNRLKSKQEAPPGEPTTKDCPYCLSTIPIKATRCTHCTVDLRAASVIELTPSSLHGFQAWLQCGSGTTPPTPLNSSSQPHRVYGASLRSSSV